VQAIEHEHLVTVTLGTRSYRVGTNTLSTWVDGKIYESCTTNKGCSSPLDRVESVGVRKASIGDAGGVSNTILRALLHTACANIYLFVKIVRNTALVSDAALADWMTDRILGAWYNSAVALIDAIHLMNITEISGAADTVLTNHLGVRRAQ
jgi:hypothetical protein